MIKYLRLKNDGRLNWFIYNNGINCSEIFKKGYYMSFKYWLAFGGLSSAGLGIAYYLHEKGKVEETPVIASEKNADSNLGSQILKTEIRESGKFNTYDYHFIPGKAYQVTFKREIKGEAQNEPGKMKSFGESSASGRMIIHSIQYQNNKVSIVAQYFLDTLSSPLFNFAIAHEFGLMKKDENTANKPKLKNSILFEISPSGRILRTLKSSTMSISNEAIFISSDILRAALFTFPSEMPAVNSENKIKKLYDEKNTAYDMSFKISKSNPPEILIQGVSEIAPPKPKPGAQDIGFYARTTRNLDVKWNSNLGLPNSLNSDASQEVKIQNQVIASGATTMNSTWVPAGDSKFAKEDLALFDVVVDLDQIRRQYETKRDQKSDKLSTWSKAQDALSKLGTMTEQQQNEAFNGICGLLKDHPEMMPQFLYQAKNAAQGSTEMNMLLGAMGSVGNADAQKAMLEVYRDADATQDTKEKIMAELALAPDALTAETKDFLKETYHSDKNQDLASQAGYALGASLNNEPDKKLVQELKKDYQDASSTEKKVYMLEVMGNDKTENFKSEITTAAGSSNSSVRTAAADALRFSTEDQTRSQLFRLTSDSNPEVKISAYHAMTYQPYDDKTFTALSGCVNSDSSSNVRAACYEVLLNHLNDPNTVSLLKSRSGSEPDEGLKMKLMRAFESN